MGGRDWPANRPDEHHCFAVGTSRRVAYNDRCTSPSRSRTLASSPRRDDFDIGATQASLHRQGLARECLFANTIPENQWQWTMEVPNASSVQGVRTGRAETAQLPVRRMCAPRWTPDLSKTFCAMMFALGDPSAGRLHQRNQYTASKRLARGLSAERLLRPVGATDLRAVLRRLHWPGRRLKCDGNRTSTSTASPHGSMTISLTKSAAKVALRSLSPLARRVAERSRNSFHRPTTSYDFVALHQSASISPAPRERPTFTTSRPLTTTADALSHSVVDNHP